MTEKVVAALDLPPQPQQAVRSQTSDKVRRVCHVKVMQQPAFYCPAPEKSRSQFKTGCWWDICTLPP